MGRQSENTTFMLCEMVSVECEKYIFHKLLNTTFFEKIKHKNATSL